MWDRFSSNYNASPEIKEKTNDIKHFIDNQPSNHLNINLIPTYQWKGEIKQKHFYVFE